MNEQELIAFADDVDCANDEDMSKIRARGSDLQDRLNEYAVELAQEKDIAIGQRYTYQRRQGYRDKRTVTLNYVVERIEGYVWRGWRSTERSVQAWVFLYRLRADGSRAIRGYEQVSIDNLLSNYTRVEDDDGR